MLYILSHRVSQRSTEVHEGYHYFFRLSDCLKSTKIQYFYFPRASFISTILIPNAASEI